MTMKRIGIVIAILTLAVAACGGGGGDSTDDDSAAETTTTADQGGSTGDPIAGADIYKGTCTSCHGPDLEGIDGLGLPLKGSEFVASQSEQELADFVAAGRSTSDPANTTGVDMPPKGGNPALSDSDLLDVSAYVKAQS